MPDPYRNHDTLKAENKRLKYALGQSLIKITRFDDEIKALKELNTQLAFDLLKASNPWISVDEPPEGNEKIILYTPPDALGENLKYRLLSPDLIGVCSDATLWTRIPEVD